MLAIAVLAAGTLNMLVTLYLKDMAETFQVTVGVASQIRTITEIIEVPMALILGFLSIRFRHKYLILAGLVSIIVGLAGVYLAPNFTFLLIFYPLDGVGSVIIMVLALVMIGDLLPLRTKGKSVGWVLSITAIIGLIMNYVSNPIIDAFGNWRLIIPLFALPISFAALSLVFFFVPSKPQVQRTTTTRAVYFSEFKDVLTNKSAVFCLIGNFLIAALPILGTVYGVTFFRSYWLMPHDIAILLFTAWVIPSFFGTWIGGYLVNWVGRKPLTVISIVMEAVFLISSVTAPILWLAIGLSMFTAFFGGLCRSARNCLYLEQVPGSRGPMMSLGKGTDAIGDAVAVALAGFVLDVYGFQLVGVTLGAVGLFGAVIFLFLTNDPTKMQTWQHRDSSPSRTGFQA